MCQYLLVSLRGVFSVQIQTDGTQLLRQQLLRENLRKVNSTTYHNQVGFILDIYRSVSVIYQKK